MRKVLKYGVGLLLGAFILIQLVPYGRAHDNPPVTKAAELSGPAKAIFMESCADCHSNLTTWPWYSNVAPSSWLVQQDVEEGRSKLNFSEWDKPQREPLQAVLRVIEEGEMPPSKYTIIHRGAKLTEEEKTTLAAGMTELFTTNPPIPQE